MALLAMLWAGLVFSVVKQTQSAVFADQGRVWWLNDDAMVSMRYADRLAEGKGLTFNDGERIEGYSNLGWVLSMTGVHALGAGKDKASLAVLILCAALAVALAFAGARIGHALFSSAAAGLLLGSALLFNRHVFMAVAEGLETLAVCAVFGAGLWVAIRAYLREARPDSAFVFMAALCFIRSDGLVPAAALASSLWILFGRRLSWGRLLLWPLGTAVAVLLFRYSYYGTWVPNTALLKLGDQHGRLAAGAGYVKDFVALYALPLTAALAGLVTARDRRLAWALALPALIIAAYVVWIGGDFLDSRRFLLPTLLSIWSLAFLFVFERVPRREWAMVTAILLVFSQPLIVKRYGKLFDGMKGSAEQVHQALEISRKDPQASLASAWAGRLFYFSGLRAIDLLGKTDAVVAAGPAKEGSYRPGHNKWDLDYSFSLQPDYVYVIRRPKGGFDAGGDPDYREDLLEHPRFKSACLGSLVLAGERGGIFRCRWAGGDKPPSLRN